MTDLRVLYVTDRWDAPYRYRVLHACEQLRADGAVANVVHVSDPSLSADVRSYGVVVLFRLPWDDRVAALVATVKRQGIPLVFDIDDLVFDPSAEGWMPFRSEYTALEWRESYGRQIAALRQTFEACDLFVGSTPALVRHAERLGKRAAEHPNVAPELYLRRGRQLDRVRRFLSRQPTIGYFAGSNTHDADLAFVLPAIRRLFAERPDARLLLGGFVRPGAAFRDLEHRVLRLPYLPWQDYPCAFAACRAVLAPLSVDNPFADGKSPLKFFEAGAFFTPAIASPSEPMRAAIRQGESGYLAATEDEWVSSMAAALVPETSVRVGRAARATVEARHSPSAVRGRLRALYEPIHRTAGRPAPSNRPLPLADDGRTADIIERVRRPFSFVRDLGAIALVARTPPKSAIDVARFTRLLDALEAGILDETSGAVLLVGPSARPWSENEHLRAGAIPGERRSTGSDPSLASPPLEIDPRRFRYAVVRMRAHTQAAHAEAQLYWATEGDPGFDERRYVKWPVDASGADRIEVIDLFESEAWKGARKPIRGMRLDPLDRPGELRVSALALLPDGLELLESAYDRARGSAPPRGPEIRAFAAESLVETLSSLSPGDRVRAIFPMPLAEARAVLGEIGNAIVERIESVREGVRATLVRAPADRGIAIVVPVYGARELTLRCLESVTRHATEDAELIVVDDASPDPDVWPVLLAFAASHPRVTLLRNESNRGFVVTANRGLACAGDRDVLLLNSDTEVSAGFLSRLRAASRAARDHGIVCPLSNNATICSVPEFCRDNPLPPSMTLAEMAELVGRTGLRRYPELVTPVGFCMYIRSDCLDAVGLFDETRFGRGFGEENDFGERAKAAGYRTVLADDVYVWHRGKASFGESGVALERANARVLEARHPGYHAAIARFVGENPLRAVHENLRWHLDRRSHALEPAPLHVLHADPFAPEPGGVEYCVRDLVRAMRLPRAVIAYPGDCALNVAEVLRGDLENAARFQFPLRSVVPRFCLRHEEAEALFAHLLEWFSVGWVHVHHLMFWPVSMVRVLERSNRPHLVTLHDYYLACPSHNLLDVRTNTACCPDSSGNPRRTAECQRALFTHLAVPRPDDPNRYLESHRALARALIEGAVHFTAPSETPARLIQRILGTSAAATILPHGYDAPRTTARDLNSKPPQPRARKAGPLRVAFVGEIAHPAKGAAAYLEVLAACAGREMEFHVFGRTDRFDFDHRLTTIENIRLVRHGGYSRTTLVPRLRAEGIDVALLLPAWPETFSYTLSELLSAGVPVIATRQGALADRLEGKPYGILVDDAGQAARALSRLARVPIALGDLQRAASELVHPTTEAWGRAFSDLYRDLRKKAPAVSPFIDAQHAARIAEARLSGHASARSAPQVTVPSARYTSRWWYPHAERLKAHAPESLRQIVRRRLAADGVRPIRRFRISGKGVQIGGDLLLDQRYFGTVRFTALSGDPHLIIATEPLDPAPVNLVRFNLWCSQPGYAFAQLYWRSASQPSFAESHSVSIPLNGQASAWQEYNVRLDQSEAGDLWYDAGSIVELRFDPINLPGPVCLGELALCRVD